jgi:four helix bundle protein
MVDRFETLPIYKESHKLVLMIYKVSKEFPKDETYGLTSQIRRSSVSIVANIIEGNSRGHKKEYLQFLYLSKGSLEETKYHLILAKDLGYLKKEEYDEIHTLTELVGKQLNGLIKYLKLPKS